MSVCVCAQLVMYLCLSVCLSVCTQLAMYLCLSVCVHTASYVCVCVRVCACVHTAMYVFASELDHAGRISSPGKTGTGDTGWNKMV